MRTPSLNPTQQREERISLTGKNTILSPASQVLNLNHKQEMPGPPDGSGWVREQERERKRWIHQASESTPATTSFIPFPPSIHSKGSLESWGGAPWQPSGEGPSPSSLNLLGWRHWERQGGVREEPTGLEGHRLPSLERRVRSGARLARP